MAFQVSPGIVVTEIDLTASAKTVSVSDAAFVGPFRWGPVLEHRNIGTEDDLVTTFGKPDDTIASYWFSAQSFLTYSNLLHVVRVVGVSALNATSAAKPFAGTVTAANNSTAWQSNTGFTTTGMVLGQTVLIGGTSFVVNSITNTTAFTTTTIATSNVANATVAGFGVLIKNDTDYSATFSTGTSGYGPFSAKYAGELGSSLKVSVCASTNAFSSTGPGSISLTLGSNVVTGTTTTFANTFVVGDYLVANGLSYQVATITNATSMVLSTAAQRTVSLTTGQWSRRWEYSSLFDRAPGTSTFASQRGGSNDELHIAVIDQDGLFTGVPGTVLERYAYLSKASDAKDGNGEGNYYPTVVSRESQYIVWLDHPTTVTTNWGTPSMNTAYGADINPASVSLNGGQTDNASVDDSALEIGYDMFNNADEIDISLVITGPASASLASYIIQNLCETRQDCVAFISPSKTAVVNNVGLEVSSITTFRNQLPSSSYGFLDSGWKYMNDKYNDKLRWVPLNGDMAGLAARTDETNDPWFSPAGFNRGSIKNVVKLAWNPKQVDRDDLYKIGVNPVVSFPTQGVLLYGDKTLLSRPSAFDRINVRRLFIILKKTIAKLAQAQLFEFNDEFTRSQFRNQVEPYLRDVKARRGVTDYRVVCDDSNNTDEVIEENRFVGDIYVKPNRVINFIQLNFIAVRSGVSFQEVTGQTQ